MPDQLINSLNSGSIVDTSLGIIGDPVLGTLTQTSYRAMKDYFTAGITGSGGGNIYTGSLLLTSSFNIYTASINNDFGQYEPTGSFNLFSSSYVHDSSSFLNLINSISGSGGGVGIVTFNNYTSSTNIAISNSFASESNYLPTGTFNAYIATTNNQFGQYEMTSSFVTFSASVFLQFSNITSSGNTGSLLLTSSFNIYTSSVTSQSLNIFASQSNYLSTGSYLTFSSSVATQFANVTSSGTGDLIQIYNSTGSSLIVSNSINVIYVDPTSFIPNLTVFLPLTASTTNNCDFYFGGIVTTGAVISNITFSTGSGSTGQNILMYPTASSVNVGESISFKYRVTNGTFYFKS